MLQLLRHLPSCRCVPPPHPLFPLLGSFTSPPRVSAQACDIEAVVSASVGMAPGPPCAICRGRPGLAPPSSGTQLRPGRHRLLSLRHGSLPPASWRWQSLRIVDRSMAMGRVEAELSCAVLITVGGSRHLLLEQQVLVEVERLFGIVSSSTVIVKAAPKDFILVLPDRGATDRVFNGGRPLAGPGFSLFFKRWTRLVLASASALPTSVNVELRGVPAHA
jgi:hypothetical protein